MEGLMVNGQLQYVKDMNDFIDLVDKYMGDDSAKWLEEHLEDDDERIAELLNRVDDACHYLNEALDSLSYC